VFGYSLRCIKEATRLGTTFFPRARIQPSNRNKITQLRISIIRRQHMVYFLSQDKVSIAAQATLSNRLRGITTVLASSSNGTLTLYEASIKRAYHSNEKPISRTYVMNYWHQKHFTTKTAQKSHCGDCLKLGDFAFSKAAVASGVYGSYRGVCFVLS
jgi:hypothetical protein